MCLSGINKQTLFIFISHIMYPCYCIIMYSLQNIDESYLASQLKYVREQGVEKQYKVLHKAVQLSLFQRDFGYPRPLEAG
jgi:hypothetical protein